MVWNNDPGRVNEGKGYGAVDWLDRFAADWSVDHVYPGLDHGGAQHALLLALRLILIVNRATPYIVDGGLRLRWVLCADCYSFDRKGGLRYADCLPNITPKVADPNQLFHHKLQASTSVGLVLVLMVLVVVTP